MSRTPQNVVDDRFGQPIYKCVPIVWIIARVLRNRNQIDSELLLRMRDEVRLASRRSRRKRAVPSVHLTQPPLSHQLRNKEPQMQFIPPSSNMLEQFVAVTLK